MIQQDMKNKERRIHPTQKPVALYKWLLKNYAKPGDKILDTHVGSASSLIACEDMGFEYIGFEIDEDYYNAATKRLNDFKAQVRMSLDITENRHDRDYTLDTHAKGLQRM
jgi:site-specific DNA-methyltransferase (adenine-specific)